MTRPSMRRWTVSRSRSCAPRSAPRHGPEAEKFSWENASDDLLRYYEMAIEKHGAGRAR